jgi:hypothetical protein
MHQAQEAGVIGVGVRALRTVRENAGQRRDRQPIDGQRVREGGSARKPGVSPKPLRNGLFTLVVGLVLASLGALIAGRGLLRR